MSDNLDTLKEMLAYERKMKSIYTDSGLAEESELVKNYNARIAALEDATSSMERDQWIAVTGKENLHDREIVIGLRADGACELIAICHLRVRINLSADERIIKYKRIGALPTPPKAKGE